MELGESLGMAGEADFAGDEINGRNGVLKKDGFKASLMTCTSDTVRTHLQRCWILGEVLLKQCAHQTFPLTAGRQRASEIRTHGNSA